MLFLRPDFYFFFVYIGTMERRFDLVIIGGGHAGIEAAAGAAQFGLDVAIVTMPGVAVASAPCNPSIGGVGKGQVVREIDALGGLMGKIADLSAIQWRVLNESKGYAVRSTRVQIDKERYPREAEKLLSFYPNITLIRERVERVKKKKFFEITTTESTLTALKVVVTTGTFLNGKLHIGEENYRGGRPYSEVSKGLSNIFEEVRTLGLRFKTGTPPRLKGKSIDFSKLEEQRTDPKAQTFHFAHGVYDRFLPQVSCYLTRTNEKTLKIVRKNKNLSPLYNGQIKAVGARYCPSLEDKAYRYPHRHTHHIFLEPESLEGDSFYPSGISSSLPKDVQCSFVKTILGLENAEISLYGHAVEYDVVDTAMLDETLQYRDIEGLYFAGQINGTSGYEEAAGQGLIGGVNAALSLQGKKKLILSREDSYIGVMIEDLISNRRDEPYRLFTARSENRLFIREDNTLFRMAPYRKSLRLQKDLDRYLEDFLTSFRSLDKKISLVRYDTKKEDHFKKQGYGPLKIGMSLRDLLKRSDLNPIEILKTELDSSVNLRVLYSVAISAKYEGHIKRAENENAKFLHLSKKTVDWKKIVSSAHIANECKERIEKIRPSTFSQLQRINGIRPATLAYVAANVIS